MGTPWPKVASETCRPEARFKEAAGGSALLLSSGRQPIGSLPPLGASYFGSGVFAS